MCRRCSQSGECVHTAALAAGCCAVLKPSPLASLTCSKLGEVLPCYRISADVLACTCDGKHAARIEGRAHKVH